MSRLCYQFRIITDRAAYSSFYHGCSTFLPVFDANIDTYDALHERSPFAVDCICMVAARVRDGGGTQLIQHPNHALIRLAGEPSETFLKCQEEVQAISCASLFSPVMRQEAVQAMGKLEYPACLLYLHTRIVLVSGWCDNGWLPGGHAVRMAMEICEWFLSGVQMCLWFTGCEQLCTGPGPSFSKECSRTKYQLRRRNDNW